MGDKNPIRTLGDYSKPSHEGYRNTNELPEGNNVVPLRSDTIRLVKNGCSFHGLRSEDPNQHLKDFLKLVDSLDLNGDNRERTCLRLYDHGSWNDPKDLAKPVKAISLPQGVLSTSDRRLIVLENQVQCLMEAHLAPKPSKPELRSTKDFEAKYNKVKAKLAFLSSSTLESKSSMVKSKGLVAEAYELDEEDVSLDDNENG
ncbi:hypothetical protein Tco_0167908 [Tanacetum coccineum]